MRPVPPNNPRYHGSLDALKRFSRAVHQHQPPPSTKTGIKNAVVYNLFVRFGTAFDHDGDGIISEEPLPSGFRETGTLLKAIALLPYIKNSEQTPSTSCR